MVYTTIGIQYTILFGENKMALGDYLQPLGTTKISDIDRECRCECATQASEGVTTYCIKYIDTTTDKYSYVRTTGNVVGNPTGQYDELYGGTSWEIDVCINGSGQPAGTGVCATIEENCTLTVEVIPMYGTSGTSKTITGIPVDCISVGNVSTTVIGRFSNGFTGIVEDSGAAYNILTTMVCVTGGGFGCESSGDPLIFSVPPQVHYPSGDPNISGIILRNTSLRSSYPTGQDLGPV